MVEAYGRSKRRVKERGTFLTLLSVSAHEGRGMRDAFLDLVSNPPPICADYPDSRHDKKRKSRDSDREEDLRRDTLCGCGVLAEMNDIQSPPSGPSTREARATEAA